jgi:hypothetical protein
MEPWLRAVPCVMSQTFGTVVTVPPRPRQGRSGSYGVKLGTRILTLDTALFSLAWTLPVQQKKSPQVGANSRYGPS